MSGRAPAPELVAMDQAGAQMRAPWAAGVAGILFAVLFTGALVLMRSSPITAASDGELIRMFAEGRDQWLFIGALYLAPFAGIMFLWFLAVVRDLIGEREDRFFATVFFGSGILFVALLFAAAAVAGSLVVGVRYLGQGVPSESLIELTRALSYTLLFAFATRAAAVFLISMGTLGLRTRALPRWLAWTAWIAGLVLLLVVAFFDWVVLILPAWVAVASLFILGRARGARTGGGGSAAGPAADRVG